MPNTHTIKLITIATLSLILSLTFSLTLFNFKANAQAIMKIELLSDANVFAQYIDEKPLVANYFTEYSEQEIIAFYQEKYGEIKNKQRIKERLMLKFTPAENMIRIIISPQNNKYQVDILIN